MMKVFTTSLLLALIVGAPAFAKRKPQPQPTLMPPLSSQDLTSIDSNTAIQKRAMLASVTVPSPLPKQSATPSQAVFYHPEFPKQESRPIELGGEFGMVGRRQMTKSDFLGHQVLMGGRVFSILPVLDRVFLRPSVGYFYKSESTAAITISQKSIEGGLGAFYSLLSGQGVSFDVGVMQRVDYDFSTISVYSAASNTPAEFYYRAGPAGGFAVNLAQSVRLHLGFEYTWTLSNPTRGYAGASSGLSFGL